MSKIITCEQVSNGHPDKICDQIADAIVTDVLKHDKNARVAIECLLKKNQLFIAGEMTTDYQPNYHQLVHNVITHIPLPDGMTVMCVDTDDEDNVVMRDCVDTPNCYCLAEAEEEGKRVVYPYELSNWSGFDLRATVVPIRHCPKCGKRLQPHMEECDNSTLYYTCMNS